MRKPRTPSSVQTQLQALVSPPVSFAIAINRSLEAIQMSIELLRDVVSADGLCHDTEQHLDELFTRIRAAIEQADIVTAAVAGGLDAGAADRLSDGMKIDPDVHAGVIRLAALHAKALTRLASHPRRTMGAKLDRRGRLIG